MSPRLLYFLMIITSIIHSASAQPQDLDHILASIQNKYRTTTLTTPIPFATEEHTSTLATFFDGILRILTTTFTSTRAATSTFYPTSPTSAPDSETTASAEHAAESTTQTLAESSITVAPVLPSSSLQTVLESESGDETSSTSLPTDLTTADPSSDHPESFVSASQTSTTAQASPTSMFMMPTMFSVVVISSRTFFQAELPTMNVDLISSPTDVSDHATTTSNSSISDTSDLATTTGITFSLDVSFKGQNSTSTPTPVTPPISIAASIISLLNATGQSPTGTVQAVSEIETHLGLRRSIVPEQYIQGNA